jgi:hypothetical protein
MTGNASFADLSAHRTRSNVRPAAVRVETASEGVDIVEDTVSADAVASSFVTA